MKKKFLHHILSISILTLLFIATNSFGMDQIILEYPELTDFFDSAEFKKQIAHCKVVTQYSDPTKNDHIASFAIEIGIEEKFEPQRKIVLNSYYINKDLLNAEEFKFVFCHELGHIHDKNLTKKTILSLVGLTGIMSGATYLIIKSLLAKEWALLFKKISIGGGFYLLAHLLFMKFARDDELYADEYSLKLTKNKDAAISAFHKRQSFIKSVSYKFNIIKYLRSLFEDHPCESDRIVNIEKKSKNHGK